MCGLQYFLSICTSPKSKASVIVNFEYILTCLKAANSVSEGIPATLLLDANTKEEMVRGYDVTIA